MKKNLKTLDRALSKAGIGSRTEARSWIGTGRVTVNGRRIETPDHWVDLARDRIALDGKPIEQREKVYLLLYKPKGYLTTYKDPEGRPTVYDLIPDLDAFVFPAGRLDLDTSGLLIMTNDSDLAERVTNPDHKVAKTYLVKCAGLVTDEQIETLRKGVELSDGPTKPAIVSRTRDSGKRSFLEMTITEGRNRQVRRMLEAINNKALKLVRIAIGSLRIADLGIGKYRELTSPELAQLDPGKVRRASRPAMPASTPASRPRRANLPAAAKASKRGSPVRAAAKERSRAAAPRPRAKPKRP